MEFYRYVMKMDILNKDTSDVDDRYLIARKCVSMMDSFMTGIYSMQSYGYDDLDALSSIEQSTKEQLKHILMDSKNESREMRYIGTLDGCHIFENWIA